MKSSSILGEELICWDFMDVDGVWLRCGGGDRACDGSRSYVLAQLRPVALVHFWSVWAVSRHKAWGESWPCGEGTTFDGGKPCGFDGKTGCGVQIGDERRHTG